jgi:hypothetical protein
LGFYPVNNLHVLYTVYKIATKFSSVELHEKHVWQLGMLGTTSAFAFRHRENNKNLFTGG